MLRQSRNSACCAHHRRQHLAVAGRRTPQRRRASAAALDADAEASSSSSDPLPPSWSAAARRAHVAVVLVEPQICENIGAAARAMRNFGIRPPEDANGADATLPPSSPHLRLVRPRDGCPPPQLSFDVACGGADLVATAGCYDSLQDALADRQVIYAATARARRQAPASLTSRQLARDFSRRCARAEEQQGPSSSSSPLEPCRVALVFGRESSGLTNEEVGRAHAVVEVDAAPEYPVLNLGAAVCALVYELWTARRPLIVAAEAGEVSEEDERKKTGGEESGGSGGSGSGSGGGGNSANNANRAAEAQQVDAFLARLYASLERGGFFVESNKRPSVERSLAGLLRRVEGLSERDLALLHGALTALSSSSSSSPQQRR
jgi:tRNA/rRNA methyltransferase